MHSESIGRRRLGDSQRKEGANRITIYISSIIKIYTFLENIFSVLPIEKILFHDSYVLFVQTLRNSANIYEY